MLGPARPSGQDGVVRFRILGPLEFWDGQAWSGISAGKQRSLLAALLVDAGQVVPTERLIFEIWGDTPPAGANNLVSIYVHKLRKMIGDESGRVLRTRAPGYQLSLEPDDLDLTRFEELSQTARNELAVGRHQRAAELFAAALGLWRGLPFVDAPPTAAITGEAERLEDMRLNVLELRIAADLGCGRYAQVTPELSRLVAEHPLREGLWVLYLRALDGAGRHAEALAAYARAREVIADELGVDPGEQLRRIYTELLVGELRQPEPLVAEAERAAAEPPPEPEPEPYEPPAQLPADITDFTGRSRDVEQLSDLPLETDDSGAVTVALVSGAGGLGKTTLAVHAAHRLRAHFPDGQLYVNLLGASPQPLTPGDVLARFLRDLGLDAARIPVDEQERAALLRTRLTGRRVLMLLDNARDAAQVRPLLPGSSSCMVIVTTRSRLPDLAITRLVDLDVLDEDDARTLFTRIAGEQRVEKDPAATQEVLAACAGLPLAIRIAGARLAARSGWTVHTLASRLRGEQRRLDELKVGDLAVRACFEVSFASLPRPERSDSIDPTRAFRLLGLWQGPAIGLPAAAALFGQPDENAADAAESLVDAHLLESPAPDTYRFHDLLRVYAAERCQADESEQNRHDAVRRLLCWYLDTIEAAARIISPNHRRVPLGELPLLVAPLAFISLDEALDWCDAERPGLLAATRQAAASGLDDLCWRLAAASMSYFYRRSHWADWIVTHEIGLRSARLLGDRLGEAWMLNNLGMAYGVQHLDQAIGYFEKALSIYQEIGDRQGESRAANNLSTACTHLHRYEEALTAGKQSLALQRELGDRYGEGIALGNMGCSYRELGQGTEAIECYQQALTIFRELDDRMAEADALSELGDVYLGMGRLEDALGRLAESLAIWRDIGDSYGQATALKLLGAALRQAGRLVEAREAMVEAQATFERLGDRDQAAEIRDGLADVS